MTRSHFRLRTALTATALLVAAASVAQAQSQGTPEQRRACRKDAMKFCRDFVPNVKLITACMEKNVRKLSPLCRTQFK